MKASLTKVLSTHFLSVETDALYKLASTTHECDVLFWILSHTDIKEWLDSILSFVSTNSH